jgi:hypothetical protein
MTTTAQPTNAARCDAIGYLLRAAQQTDSAAALAHALKIANMPAHWYDLNDATIKRLRTIYELVRISERGNSTMKVFAMEEKEISDLKFEYWHLASTETLERLLAALRKFLQPLPKVTR